MLYIYLSLVKYTVDVDVELFYNISRLSIYSNLDKSNTTSLEIFIKLSPLPFNYSNFVNLISLRLFVLANI